MFSKNFGALASVGFIVLIFTWPAFVNGGPIWFWDSFQYLSAPEQGFKRVLGIDLGQYLHDSWGEPIAYYASDIARSEAIRAGRSVYYGTATLLLSAAFGFWGPILFQAALIVSAIALTLRVFVKHLSLSILVIGSLVGLLTSAPFFTSYLMPDVLAAMTILAGVHLTVRWTGMTGWEKFFWFGALCFAGLSHTSHLVVICGLLLAWLIAGPLLRWQGFWKGGVALASAIAVIIAGEALFAGLVKKHYGEEPIRPPFLSVRMIVDGTGLDYLNETCPGSGFVLCDYLDRLNTADSNHLLWSHDPDTGVFNVADAETQRAMSDEQPRFIMEVTNYDPGAQISASLSRVAEQLGKFSLDGLSYTGALRHRLDDYFPGEAGLRIRDSGLYTGLMDLRVLSLPNYLAVAFGVSALIFFAFRKPSLNMKEAHDDNTRLLWVLTAMVVIGVLGNAATTGIFSGPRDRYQARVIWLIPFMAFIWIWCTALETRVAALLNRLSLRKRVSA